MRVLVLTPLFPPDVAPSAVYVKTLLAKLQKQGHTITCIHYGEFPEQVAGVTFVSTKKSISRFGRLIRFGVALWRHRQADVCLIENGPSVELPAAFLWPWLPTVCLYSQSDVDASHQSSFLYRHLRQFFATHLPVITPNIPTLTPPLRHPLEAVDATREARYEADWQQHLTHILTLCQKT
jgi:hypothetical protein